MNRERNSTIDFIKFFAIFAVVCIHTNIFYEVFLFEHKDTGLNYLINTLSKFAVPFFFAAAGYLFGQKMANSENRDRYFRKYTGKIAALYFGWTFFYFLFGCVKNICRSLPPLADLIDIHSIKSVLRLIIEVFYLGFASVHLWYLIALVWSIVILYVALKRNLLSLLLPVGFLLNLAGLFGDSYRGLLHLPFGTRNALFFGLFYCALGCWFACREEKLLTRSSRLGTWVFVAGFALFEVLQIVERTILIRNFDGSINDNFFLSTIPMILCLFMVVLKNKSAGRNSKLTGIGEKALGIYIIHPFFLNLITYVIEYFRIPQDNFLVSLVYTLLVFLVSWLSYELFILLKNSFLRKEHAVKEG